MNNFVNEKPKENYLYFKTKDNLKVYLCQLLHTIHCKDFKNRSNLYSYQMSDMTEQLKS